MFGFLVGGMVWFAVPFCMATTNGLAGRAITTHPSYSPLYIDDGASGSGLTPARVLSAILGHAHVCKPRQRSPQSRDSDSTAIAVKVEGV